MKLQYDRLLTCIFKPVKHSLATIFYKVESILKPLRAVIVWIRHAVSPRMAREVICHSNYFRFIHGSWGKPSQAVEVGVIHCHYDIKPVEV